MLLKRISLHKGLKLNEFIRMIIMSSYYQGTYKPMNPEKYIGNKDPYYRSSWEKKAMVYFDSNSNVLAWGSETIAIPYFSIFDINQ